jgi:mitochondrial Rho GTPase 1
MPRASVHRGFRTEVRIVVVGDNRTGKSSLIRAVASNNFEESLVPVLPPQNLPIHKYRDRVPITVIDTSSR